MFELEFLITSLVVVLIPGTGVIYTVSTGLLQGRKAAMAAAVGCTAGIIPHLLASISGLSLILHTSAVAFQVVKFIGAAYLLYMAWSMWRQTGMIDFNSAPRPQSHCRTAVRGILINILNPKLSIFFLAFLPQFVKPDSAWPTMQLLSLSGMFMFLTLVVFILYGIFAHSVRSYVINSPKLMTRIQRSFAAIFALLGFRLAVAER